MKYKINVSRQDGLDFQGNPRWVHYFRAEVDVFPEDKAIEIARDLQSKYPDHKIGLTRVETLGYTVPFE